MSDNLVVRETLLIDRPSNATLHLLEFIGFGVVNKTKDKLHPEVLLVLPEGWVARVRPDDHNCREIYDTNNDHRVSILTNDIPSQPRVEVYHRFAITEDFIGGQSIWGVYDRSEREWIFFPKVARIWPIGPIKCWLWIQAKKGRSWSERAHWSDDPVIKDGYVPPNMWVP